MAPSRQTLELPRLISHELRIPVGRTAQGANAQWTLGTTLAGQALYTVDGHTLPTTPGRILMIRPRIHLHWRTLDSPAKHWHILYSAFHPRPHWLDWFAYPEVIPGFLDITPSDPAPLRRAQKSIRHVHELANSPRPCAVDLALNALEHVLLTCWESRPSQGPRRDPRVSTALHHLRANLNKPITLEELARISKCSRAHLALLFARQIGTPPIQHHESLRITRAMELLRATLDPIKSIAISVGYQDPKYFSKRFKHATGQTPAHYRRQNQPHTR